MESTGMKVYLIDGMIGLREEGTCIRSSTVGVSIHSFIHSFIPSIFAIP